jgi:hypothetical protein
MFTYEKFGHVGKGNRIKLPLCVEGKIKEMIPNVDGNYANPKCRGRACQGIPTVVIRNFGVVWRS